MIQDCLICKNGGELICCDFIGCTKVYHLSCLKLNSVPDEKWYCPTHFCSVCNNNNNNYKPNATFNCTTCPKSFCENHLNDFEHLKLRKNFIICSDCLPTFKKEIGEN